MEGFTASFGKAIFTAASTNTLSLLHIQDTPESLDTIKPKRHIPIPIPKHPNPMHLYIAEKPSLGRAIAAALPGPHQKGQGWIRCGTGENAATVSWCIGHLLEQAPPDDYDERFKRWSLDHLPIIPEQWKLKPRSQARGQLKTIREQAQRIEVKAGRMMDENRTRLTPTVATLFEKWLAWNR